MDNIYPGPGEGAYSQFLNQYILPGSLITLRLYTSILEKVNINPARFTTLFWLVSRPLLASGSLAFAMGTVLPIYKRTAMHGLKLFTIINLDLSIFEPARVTIDS
jgi:hypothetical protein